MQKVINFIYKNKSSFGNISINCKDKNFNEIKEK
jgi:hypothetical protein